MWLAAIAITAGFVAAEYLPGDLTAAYSDKAGPLLAGLWLSQAFRRWWHANQSRVLAAPPTQLRVVLTLAAALLLLGGFRLLWVDPWLFGPMLWPLAEVVITLRRRERKERISHLRQRLCGSAELGSAGAAYPVHMTAEADMPTSGRLLGLDAGERRVGVAISDPDQRLAVPVRTLMRSGGSEMRDLEQLARSEEVAGLVVGLPLSLSGESGEQAELAREFARVVQKRLNLPVAFWDERLSSQEAERMLYSGGKQDRRGSGNPRRGAPARQREKGATDQVAATIILQAYLDSRRGPRFED